MHGEPTNFQKSGPPELTKEEIENPQVIFESFFERLEKLMEAAWVMR